MWGVLIAGLPVAGGSSRLMYMKRAKSMKRGRVCETVRVAYFVLFCAAGNIYTYLAVVQILQPGQHFGNGWDVSLCSSV